MTNKASIELLNTTPLDFFPVNEEYREYDYIVGGQVVTVRVEQPRYVNIHPVHGAHRILDADGVSHYMPGDWLTRVALRWKANEGAAHFEFTVAPLEQSTDMCCAQAEEVEEEPTAVLLPDDIAELFSRLGRFEPFTTDELEGAGAFFRALELEITR